jgi:hypothetical protein
MHNQPIDLALERQLRALKFEIEINRQRLNFARAENKWDLETRILILLSELHAQYFNLSSKNLEPLYDQPVRVVFGPGAEEGIVMVGDQYQEYIAALNNNQREFVGFIELSYVSKADVA